MKKIIKISSTRIIIYTAIFLVLFDNISFFKHVTDVYPLSAGNAAYLVSLAAALTAFIILLFTLVSSKYTTKPLIILILVVSSVAGYFMDTYSTVLDHSMIRNIFETNMRESMDLFSLKLLSYLFFLGIVPSIIVYKTDIEHGTYKAHLISKLKVLMISLAIIVVLFLSFSKFYTSFFREHKPLRYYTNPTYYIYSFGKYLNSRLGSGETVLSLTGTDAKIPDTDTDRELIILVVGEAARGDRFSFNGYERETNPLLKQEEIISFSNMHSCGTSTAVSVPCMFSLFPRSEYSDKKAKSTQNLLDVLSHAGITVLWRDNNSDSKGVALRVPYEDYRSPDINPVCDTECRDVGMLADLPEYIDKQKSGDIFIVLHQMGNHGPAYYKRYPESFEQFTPVCRTNQLEKCTKEEISNAYDNAILYTDYFLSKVINLLKPYSNRFETAMLYIADHGESLGENGLYLHGLPYMMSPESQTNIGAFMWFGDSFKINSKSIRDKSANEFSQDNLFHTILGLMEVETSVYDKKMDIIHDDFSPAL